MHLNVVIFPAPFNPKRPKHSPGFIPKFKFFIATTSSLAELQQIFVKTFLKFLTLTENSSFFFVLFPSTLIDTLYLFLLFSIPFSTISLLD